MTDITFLKQAARIVYDETGKPVVQIPLALWQEWLAQFDPTHPQIQQINALLRDWAEERDDVSEAWCEEFRQFLKENPLDFGADQDFKRLKAGQETHRPSARRRG